MVRTPLTKHQAKPQHVAPSPQQCRTEFRCSPSTGRRWSVQVPVASNPPDTQSGYEWRINPRTGDRYQVLVTLQQQLPPAHGRPALVQPSGQFQQSPFTGHHLNQSYSPDLTQPGHDNSQQSASVLHDQSSNMSRNERVAGIVSLLEGGGATKKIPKVIEFAKKCPTKWSKSATISNVNLPLYAWGVLEEVEAAMSGRSPALQNSVVLGKLRHLKNTLEVCCQNSTSQEFSGYGWDLAKDYSTKVNDEIDQGRESWQNLKLEVKTSTLMSASMENPRPLPKFDPLKKTTSLRVTEKKDICPTYNKCREENKCDYEVANPTKTCFRKHECTWCRAHKNQSWSHQASKCRNKAASGGANGSG